MASPLSGAICELSNQPFTPAEEAYVVRLFAAAGYRLRLGDCFANTARLVEAARAQPDGAMHVSYALGVVDDHAVAVLNGKAVDVAWPSDEADAGDVTTGDRSKLLRRARCNVVQRRYRVITHDGYGAWVEALSRRGLVR